ncbi:MAG TPA: filamentous hemagglutinin N-terminal domain-containing protein, partial [Coleofasciculaceae cyanobacterium]
MNKSKLMKRGIRRQFGWIGRVSSPGWLWLALALPSFAQIVQDGTLSSPSSVTVNGTQFVITGGTQAGGNLFHSFRDFSVPAGQTASFQNIDPGIRHIISRITGSSISRINGAIEALQTGGAVSPADFFLINPNGVIFGRNASLRLGGSFLATTGDRLTFADGFQFRADGRQTAPLLSVSVPTGIQLSPAAGPI